MVSRADQTPTQDGRDLRTHSPAPEHSQGAENDADDRIIDLFGIYITQLEVLNGAMARREKEIQDLSAHTDLEYDNKRLLFGLQTELRWYATELHKLHKIMVESSDRYIAALENKIASTQAAIEAFNKAGLSKHTTRLRTEPLASSLELLKEELFNSKKTIADIKSHPSFDTTTLTDADVSNLTGQLDEKLFAPGDVDNALNNLSEHSPANNQKAPLDFDIDVQAPVNPVIERPPERRAATKRGQGGQSRPVSTGLL